MNEITNQFNQFYLLPTYLLIIGSFNGGWMENLTLSLSFLAKCNLLSNQPLLFLTSLIQDSEINAMDENLFSNLPTDLFLDIISRLPLKTISNCKYINKSWNTLILSPLFAEIHYARASISPCFLFRDDNHKSFYIINGDSFNTFDTIATAYNIQFKDFNSCYEIVGSVNGMLCFYSEQRNCYYICNPITRKYVIISNSMHSLQNNVETIASGLGFDLVSNEYKVIRILRDHCRNGNKIEVYTLGLSNWRELETNVAYVMKTQPSNVLLNGCIHWVAYLSYTQHSMVILKFDIATEDFSIVQMPIYMNLVVKGLTVLRGCLCVILGSIFGDKEIWVLEDYGDEGSWCRGYVFEGKSMYGNVVSGNQVMELGNGEVLLLNEDQELGYYDLEYESFRYIDVQNLQPDVGRMELPIFFLGSLFSPEALGVSHR